MDHQAAISQIKELSSQGKSPDEIRQAIGADGHPDLEDLIEIFTSKPNPQPASGVAPANRSVVAPQPTGRVNPPALSGSEVALEYAEREKRRKLKKRFLIGVAILLPLALVAALVGSATVKNKATQAKIDQMQTSPAKGKMVANGCFTVNVPSDLQPKISSDCAFSAQKKAPVKMLIVAADQSNHGSVSPEQYAKSFTVSSKALNPGNGGCVPAHPQMINPTTVRHYGRCVTKSGQVIWNMDYLIAGSSQDIKIIGLSESLEDNPAPSVYASLKVNR